MKKKTYISPKINIIHVGTHGLLAASANDSPYGDAKLYRGYKERKTRHGNAWDDDWDDEWEYVGKTRKVFDGFSLPQAKSPWDD